MGNIKKIIILLIAVLLSILILFIPIETTGLVSSQETYIENESYTEIEYYTVSEPYDVYSQVSLSYEQNAFYPTSATYPNLILENVVVKNTDTEGGYFWIDLRMGGCSTCYSHNEYIPAGSSYTFELGSFSKGDNPFPYAVIAPTKTVTQTKYRDVQKSREVIKFRDVPKQRTVWNPISVQKPLYKIIPPSILALCSVILLILGVVVFRRGRKSNQEVISPSDELESVPLPLQESEQAKGFPSKPEEKNTISVKSTYEYLGAKIYYKIKVENNTSETIGDIKVHLFVPDVFLLKEKEKSFSMLEPKESKTVTFEIRPTGECGDCNVSGKVEYYDYSTKGRQMLDIETKSLHVICPVLKRKEIDVNEWEQITEGLIKAEENIKELSIPAENLFNITSRVIKDSGMFMLKPDITSTPQLFNGIAMFYAEGVTGYRYAVYMEVVGGARKSRMILKVLAEKDEALIGFYHRILDDIEKRIDVKIFIDDTIVQQHIHIGDRIGTQVKDSVVQRSNIGAGEKKCPECGREVEANEKFCNECGARL